MFFSRWTRTLLEQTTGIYTGSVYNDTNLYKNGLLGELTYPTDGETLFQKSHDIQKKYFSQRVDGILFVIRNPFDAIIAEWKRRNGGGHTGQAEEEIFKIEKWPIMASNTFKLWVKLTKNVLKKHRGTL
jgi:hypothetical protein